MKKIKDGFILTSAALTISPRQVRFYQTPKEPPRQGDLVYGQVAKIGEHSTLENKSGRIHSIHAGSFGIFVYGTRYAPDYFEGMLPETCEVQTDLIARSGIIGSACTKNSAVKDPTRINVIGYVVDENGRIVNTHDTPLIIPRRTEKKTPRSPMILVCGTAMNCGKTTAAVACVSALSALGYNVHATKVTGTAGLKDILYMNDAGASAYADFTFFGHPSTYMLENNELLDIFNKLDLKYANNPKNFWVVEFADGIVQRETEILLHLPEVRSRIHRFIFCAADAFGAIGGLQILKEKFDLVPDALSGKCSSSPLMMRELTSFTDIPVFNNLNVDTKQMKQILVDKRK
jgi:hypothetical protein